MQSQQKRVKWSRGETAEALEERTDTGITQASVELMKNCIPDIYGNISRRPGLRVLNSYTTATNSGFLYDEYMQVFPFYITENDYILVGVHYSTPTELIRIKNNIIVYKQNLSNNIDYPKTSTQESPILGVTKYRPVSCAQQNNYMLIADAYNVWKLQISGLDSLDSSFTVTCDIWKFSAGWYAPNGTQTKQINNVILPGLKFDGHFTGYTYTNIDGTTTVYSLTDTGLTGQTGKEEIESQIPVGSIVQLPKIGTYFRIEGYVTEGEHVFFPSVTFDSVQKLANGVAPTQTGKVCVARSPNPTPQPHYPGYTELKLEYYSNGTLIESQNIASGIIANVHCSAYGSGYAQISSYIDNGYHFTDWSEGTITNLKVYAFGSLLTPVVDDTATDSTVKVEYGYTSLEPDQFALTGSFPHPRKLTFTDQRLWAGGWAISTTNQYPIVIGSQIARYNDLKNDYNQENEPITLDILTQYKETILHLVDYNGLKIMTESYEYAYNNGGIVKQSANGSFEFCEPIVFDSLCLYIDSTGCQVKAMQYEFQSNIFNSTTINQMAPHDLVWYPWCMAQYEDKYNSTGKHLFLVNREDANARVAVCNFVPGNQAEIWSRWTFPITNLGPDYDKPFVHSVVNLKNGTLFLLAFNPGIIVPAVLDFSINTDCESPVYTIGTSNYFAPLHSSNNSRIYMKNTEVAVYADGEFQFITTTDATGAITDDISQLTNVTVGLPIHAKIVSHPIDVGGKTKSIKKRIGKSVFSVHNTEPNAITINGKTGYMNPQKDKINFYGVTGMKDEIKYILTNNNGAMFHLESLLMNIEYGTLDS
jgi:hypothetical protein